MKPIFAIDITENKDNEEMLADRFVSAEISESCAEELDRLDEKMDGILEKTKSPLAWRVLSWLSGAAAILSVLLLTTSLEEIGFRETIERFWFFALLFVACTGAWLALRVWSAKYAEKILSAPENRHASTSVDNALLNAYHELGVPEDARDVDLLCFTYKWKNGVPVPKGAALVGNLYLNISQKIYAHDGILFLADARQRHEFKISDMRAIQTVKKSILLADWNKDEPHNKGEYKKYRIRVDNNGNYVIKPYHILEMIVDGEEMGIYFPSYELPIFEELTGLRATEE